MSALADTTNTINMETEAIVKDDLKPEKVAEVVEAEAASGADVADISDSESCKTAIEVPDEMCAELDAKAAAETSKEAAVAETPAETVNNEVSQENVDKEAKAEEVVMEVAEEQKTASEVRAEGTPEVEETKEQKQEKFDENFLAGRRFMKTSEFDKAAEKLSFASELGAEIFGEGHEDTFDVMFLYGQALLELAKIEDSVFSNALTDMPKEGDGEEAVEDSIVENPENVPQEERAEIKQKVEEALGVVSEETIEEAAEGEGEAAEAEAETAEGEEEAVEAAEADEVAAETAEEDAGEQIVAESDDDNKMEVAEGEEQEQGQEESDEAEEDDDQLKLSWEILEMARSICEKKIKSLEDDKKSDAEVLKKWALNKADVLTSLGEHGIVDSKHEQAQTDLLLALEIQAAHLSATSRFLANTNHLLGKAFNGDSLFEKAATHFSNAKNILISKVEELKKELQSASKEAKTGIESDIKEIEGIIPELELFVTDSLASEEQNQKIKEQAKKELASVAEAINKLPTEEANDITNMVRRPAKRPASSAEPTEEAKKRKSEEAVPVIAEEANMEVVEETAKKVVEETANKVVEEAEVPEDTSKKVAEEPAKEVVEIVMEDAGEATMEVAGDSAAAPAE